MRVRAAFAALGLTAAACLSMLNTGAQEWSPPGRPAVTPHAPVRREPCADRDLLGTPEDAYRFATGEEIGTFPYDEGGTALRRIRIDRPLDFAAVTDHAEWLGEVALCTRPDSPGYASDGCRAFRGEARAGLAAKLLPSALSGRMSGVIGLSGRRSDICGEDGDDCRAMLGRVWREQQATNERWYDRTSACRFTTFHAWEYSASPERSKIHRNVILRNEIVPELPISWIDEPEADALMRASIVLTS